MKLIALKNALSQKRIILNLTYFIYLKSSLVEQAIMHSDLTMYLVYVKVIFISSRWTLSVLYTEIWLSILYPPYILCPKTNRKQIHFLMASPIYVSGFLVVYKVLLRDCYKYTYPQKCPFSVDITKQYMAYSLCISF